MTLFVKVSTLIITALIFVVFVQCRKTDNEPSVSHMRIVHVQPDGLPDITVTTDGRTLATNLTYNNPGNYINTPTGQVLLSVYDAQTAIVLLNVQLNSLSANSYYTLLLAEEATNVLSAILLSDTIARSDTGKVYLRFVNASPDAGKADVYSNISTDTLFHELVYNPQNPSDMAALRQLTDAGVWNFTLVNSESPYDTLLQLNQIALESGGSYTLLLSGYKQVISANQAPLSAQIISQRP